MKKELSHKQAYVRPAIEVVHMPSENQLMKASFPNTGGHNKAGDDGSDINDAKKGWFGDEFEEEEENVPHWGI